MRPPAVKKRAIELGLEVWQPSKVRTDEFAEKLRALEADVAVVVAYGRIVPRAVLNAPRTGCVNVHASLLPPWPGAHTVLGDRRIKVHRSVASTLDPEGATPGQVIALDPEGILVACAEGTLEIQELQESGRKRVDARAFATGRGVAVGDRFASGGSEA